MSNVHTPLFGYPSAMLCFDLPLNQAGQLSNRVFNAAKLGQSADPVSAVTKKVKRQDVGGR